MFHKGMASDYLQNVCSMNIYRKYLILTIKNSFVVMFMLFIVLRH